MSRAPILYQEVCLSPSPASPSTILDINTTSQSQPPPIGAGRKRGFDEISGLDEESYARKYLATEGCVFFRRKDRAPRSFLWRVLEDRKVLEVQCVDLVHQMRSARSESWLTFRIILPSEILKNGVAFADPEDTDALDVFVLTAGTELHTFTLKRDILTREAAPSEFDVTTCYRKYESNSLSFRHPYRLVAISTLELLISLHDGGLMRLERNPNESGTQWRETFFTEGGWGDTLRGLISLKRHQTVRYGNLELEPNAVAAMAKSPDGKFIWTVTLDHELKAWNTQTGKAVAHMDVLNERLEEEGRKQPKYVMSAEQGTLLQLVTLPQARTGRSVARMDENEAYFIVLRSPKDHQFKFYQASSSLSAADGEGMKFEDLQPRQALVPPIDELMNTNIWHLEDFYIHAGAGWRNTQIWIRARSGTLCKTFTLTFDLLEDNGEAADLELLWQSGWTVVDPGLQTSEVLRTCAGFPGDLENVADGSSTPTEKWLEFIFQPERFSTASMETALHIYRKGRGLSAYSGAKGLNAPESPLQERLTQAITSKIILRRLPNEQPDYDGYQSAIQAQWKTFYSLLSHLHTRRHDSIGFAFDAENALPWTIFADFVAPIRGSSYFERLALNQHLLQDEKLQLVEEEVANKVFPSDEAVYFSQLLATAKNFRSRISPEFRERFRTQVITEALSHESGDRKRNEKRVRALYEMLCFNGEVMDDDFLALESSAESLGGLGSLDDHVILGVLECPQHDADDKGADSGKELNRYGDKFTFAVAQETLERDRGMLLDMLNLVVFMYGDLDQADLHSDFVSEVGPIYEAIIVRVKHNEMISWLASNLIEEPQKQHGSSRSSQTPDKHVNTVTLLERIFIGDWAPKGKRGESLPELLTLWSKLWVYGAKLHEAWDGVSGHIMAFLINEECYDLATDFMKFLSQAEDSSSWLRYLEGRLFLATGEYALSSLKFRSAADGMAEAKGIGGTDTAHLLSAEERNHFGMKHSSFFHHVSALFEKGRVFSYAADFARLALDLLENDEALAGSMAEIDRRKAMADISGEDKVLDTQVEIKNLKVWHKRDDIRNRIFNAEMQTGRFTEAFDALVGLKEKPNKKANLSQLIEACVKQDAVSTLLELPFGEGDLVQEADAILLGLAKKNLASGSGLRQPYHQVLYAFRTQHSNFRGAAEILYEYLERLRYSYNKHGMQDPEDETLIQAYVLLINTLACCREDDAWLLADPIEEVHGAGRKRKLVTIGDVRREYGAELDKRSDILQGRFPLVGGEEMDML